MRRPKSAPISASLFPRNDAEAEAAPRLAKVPLVWVQSRGNRDGRPIYGLERLKAMGYRACIDAQLLLGVGVHFMKQALEEMQKSGDYTGIGNNQFTAVRKEIEDLIGLDDYYQVEAETVEK